MPALATLLVVALAIAAVFGGNTVLQTQSDGSDPITADETAVSLSSGDNVVVDDAAIATQGTGDDARTVKEFASDEPFSMFALTWYGEADIAAFVRAEREDGSWSEWYQTDPLNIVSEDGKTGTELIYVEPTTRVQVNVSGVDLELPGDAGTAEAPAAEDVEVPAEQAPAQEAPAEQAPVQEAPAEQAPVEQAPAPAPAPAAGAGAPVPPSYDDIKPVADVTEVAQAGSRLSASDIEAVFIDGKIADDGITQVVDGSNTNGMPEVISRAGWRANESIRCGSPSYSDPVSAVTVHHTAGSNNYSENQSPGIVRGIYQYHASNLGWCDVGYGALVDKYGNIYEGRAGGLDKAVQGAHVGGFNQNTWGVSLMGNYQNAQPTQAALEAIGELAGWKAAVHGFDPKGTDEHYAEFSFSGSRYAQGQGGTFPNINAHRDFHYNECPGQYLYAELDTIRDIASQRYNAIGGGLAGSDTNSSTSSTSSTSPTTSSTVNKAADTNDAAQEPATGSDDGSSQATGPAFGTITHLVESLTSGDEDALATAGASVVLLVLTALLDGGALEGQASENVAAGFTRGAGVTDLPNLGGEQLSIAGGSDVERKWNEVYQLYGGVLGQPNGGVTGAADTGLEVALFDRGLIIDSDAVGARALWGGIADAWAAQGLDAGPLGLPLNEEYATGEGDKVRVDFEGGSITYDPATQTIDVQTA